MTYKQLEFEFMKEAHEQERWENASWLEKLSRKIIGVKNQKDLNYLYSLENCGNAMARVTI